MQTIIKPEPVNTGRQPELDVAKGLAVLFMVAIHSQIAFAGDGVRASALGYAIDLAGGIPAAPVFMFLLGVGVVYTKRATPLQLAGRGFSILALGYGLNIMRETLPALVAWEMQGKGGADSMIEGGIAIDILQFAGLAFMLFGIIRSLRWHKHQILLAIALAAAFCMLNPCLLPVKVEGVWAAAVTGLFWGSSRHSYFPFLSWAFYPLAGFVFGSLLIRCRDKNRFYAVLCAGSAVAAAGFYFLLPAVFGLEVGINSEYEYYHHALGGNLLFTACVCLWISILFFVAKILPGCVLSPLKRWCTNVTGIYVIHFLILGWLSLVLEANSLPCFTFLILAGAIMLASDVAAYLCHYHKTAAGIPAPIPTPAHSGGVPTPLPEHRLDLSGRTGMYSALIACAGLVLLTAEVARVHKISTSEVKQHDTVLVYGEEENLWYPARVSKVEDSGCMVKYYAEDIKDEFVEYAVIRPENLKIGMGVKVYDRADRLVDAIILARNGDRLTVRLGNKKQCVTLGNIAVPPPAEP